MPKKNLAKEALKRIFEKMDWEGGLGGYIEHGGEEKDLRLADPTGELHRLMVELADKYELATYRLDELAEEHGLEM